MRKFSKKHLIGASLATVLGGLTSAAYASGFQLSVEESAAAVATYGAGGAAIAEDASTGFNNPAGLTRLKGKQLVVAGTGVFPRTEFNGSVTSSSPFGTVTGSGKSKGGKSALIPAMHFALPFNERVVFGMSVTVPFGLSTDYSKNAFTRYAATKSEIKTVNISPAVGFKVTDQLSLGAGIGVQYIEANLNSVTRITFPGVGAADFTSENKGSDWGFSWHVGGLYEFTPQTRVGLSHRSQVKHTLSGDSKLTGVLGTPREYKTNNLKADVTLPSTTMLSAFHELNDQWAIMGTAAYTNWSSVDTVRLQNVASPLGPTTSELKLGFRNTWRFAVGTQYRYNEKWMFRAGLGYDQTPVRGEKERTIRLPDNNRFAISVGAQYKPVKQLSIDVGYMHLFIKDAKINHTAKSSTSAGAPTVSYNGTSKNTTDLVGVQLTWDIDAI